jgi:DNA-binding transcriptional MerR regulator
MSITNTFGEVSAKMSDNNAPMRVYGSKDLEAMLQVKPSTLRRYCKELEEAGYRFSKNERQQRGFFDSDVANLRHFISLVREGGLAYEEAAKIVVSRDSGSALAVSANEKMAVSDAKDKLITRQEMQELERKIEGLALMIQSGFEKLNQRMDEQDRRERQSLDTQSNRDIALKEALKEIAETKKQLAANSEQSRGVWFWLHSLFGKK